MSTTIPEGAASPSAAQAPPQPPAVAIAVAVAPAVPVTRTGRLHSHIDSVGKLVAAIGIMLAPFAGVGAYVSGGFDWAWDKVSATSQTQSQVTAIDERLKVLEGDKGAIAKDREEVARIARDLDRTSKDLERSGVDVRALQDLQRRLELRVERLDALLEVLREKRR